MKKKSTIIRFLLSKVLYISIGTIVLIGTFWMWSEYSEFRAESKSIRENLLASHKELIKSEVDKALSYLTYRKEQIDKQLKQSIKERVLEAHAIAENIFKEQQSEHSMDEVQKMVKDALRPIRFNNGLGYFFAFNLQGVEELFADRPEMEGKNMLPLQNIDNQFVVKDMLDIAATKEEGYYKYRWTKPNAGGYFSKIAFVKLFKPFNWVIGCGEYTDDVKRDIQTEVIEYIEQVRYRGDGYIFVTKWDGTLLTSPGKGENNLGVTDLNSVKIVRELIRISKKGNGYLEYVMPRLDGTKQVPKLVYVAGIPEWEWYVGTGIYIDEIDTSILEKKEAVEKRIYKHIGGILVVLAMFILLVYLLVVRVARKTSTNINFITDFFKKAAAESTTIDFEMLDFKEFEILAHSANEMIMARNQAEEQLRKSEERLNLALDAVTDAVWDWRVDTGEVYFSSRWYTMLGYEPYELPQQFETWRKLLHPNDLAVSEKTLVRHLEMAEPFKIEFRMHTKDNQWRWILARGKTVEADDRGKAVRMLGTHMDITERKQMEERIQQTQKLESIGSLAGGIAHDFNNILFPIVGMAELLLEDLPSESMEYKKAKGILKAGQRGSDLVKQILTFSRQAEHKKIPTRVQSILREVLTLSRSTIPSDIQINQDIQSDGGLIIADPTQIHQVIMNIITNAYHAVEAEGGEISVRLNQKVLDTSNLPVPNIEPGKYVILSISDNGQGIPPELIDKIFDPYFTTKEQGKGTGLGLAIVHGIVQEHGGNVIVTSELSKGTTFHIYLPVINNTDASVERVHIAENDPVGNERILLVDDEVAIANIEKQILERLGYKVTERNSSTDALNAFISSPVSFDLVITDMTMPNMTGDRLAKELKSIRSDIPIIICTGFSERINKEKAKVVGISGFLMKPVIKSDMAKMVRKVLDEAKSENQG